ncbi:uncharacterized protein B4U80_03497 [Leptotrombidium deliense]|uniref:Uncharacterized protein n=1 Tax=Leptotrombidium deliense TaxID=299467 RepID=A0A443STW4_9ACAR|nr:uncharacterized protein B4U80_03497 [Leptotrombidium deliense]
MRAHLECDCTRTHRHHRCGRNDVRKSNADFDSYWEDEARNPNRNRIRIGRQYQATVPPLLKPGESDGRQLEHLETLKWKPENDLTEQQLDQYLSLAKAVALFARAINNSASNSQTDGESENNDNDNVNSDSGEQQTADEQSSASQQENKSKENSDSLVSQASDHLHCALKGLVKSDFVTSHHPFRHDVGCKVPINSSDKSATVEDNCESRHLKVFWNPNETDLFAKALNACGKNFSAIKKDFLPWKSVQSIIEYYYLRLNRSKSETNHCTMDDKVSTDCSSVVTANVASTSTEESLHSPTFVSRDCKGHVNGVSTALVECETSTSEDYNVNCVNNNLEIKALKAKPVLPSTDDANNSVSNLGSLKFYMDGQLVLKLNAKQELTGRKCHWVESQDTPKFSRPVRKGNKKLLIEKSEADLKLGHVHNDKCLHQSPEDGEEGSVDSSDEDSLGSSESNALASPLSVTARKAKVKVENNCFVPLPSPCGLTTSKDQSSSRCVDSSIVKREPLCSPTCSSNVKYNENDCKRKLKVPPWPPDKKKNSAVMDMKWSVADCVQPPEAHAASRKVNHSGFDKYANSAIPVDLTRKSSTSSPNCTKSPSFSSPSVSTSGDIENRKMSSSPINPMYPLSLTPNSVFSSLRQPKSVKDLKTVDMCQKTKNSKCDLSPDKSKASLNWFSNPLMSYLPIYEQYYQYYCRFGIPQLANTSSAPVDKAESEAKDDLENKGQTKTISEPVFDKDEEEKGMLYQLLNKDKSSD